MAGFGEANVSSHTGKKQDMISLLNLITLIGEDSCEEILAITWSKVILPMKPPN